MKKQALTGPQERLMEKARQTAEQTRLEEGRNWLYAAGKPFGVAKWGFLVIGLGLTVVLLAFFIGLLLAVSDGNPSAALVYDTRLTGLCLLLIVAALIFWRCRQYAVGGILALAEAILFLPNQGLRIQQLIEGDGWKRILLYTLPTVLLALCGVYLLACRLADRLRVKRIYADFIRRIQATHVSRDGGITTAEEWDAYVEEFLAEPVHIKPKRSLRQKNKKGKKTAEEEA